MEGGRGGGGRREGGGGEEGRVGVHVCMGVYMCVNKVGGGGRGREGYEDREKGYRCRGEHNDNG